MLCVCYDFFLFLHLSFYILWHGDVINTDTLPTLTDFFCLFLDGKQIKQSSGKYHQCQPREQICRAFALQMSFDDCTTVWKLPVARRAARGAECKMRFCPRALNTNHCFRHSKMLYGSATYDLISLHSHCFMLLSPSLSLFAVSPAWRRSWQPPTELFSRRHKSILLEHYTK